MSFLYKNPVSNTVLTDTNSVLLNNTFGTNFSVYNTGGYMEVWSISDLQYSTFGSTGLIQNSGNTIPIVFYKRPVSAISDRVSLSSDGITSGRRRLGMLVFVHETQKTYQFTIPNYETLWNNAEADGCITTGSTTYDVFNRVGGVEKSSGQALIDAWTGSTIEGVSGVTRDNARWKIFYGTDITVTAGTYNNTTGTATFTNTTGGTFNVTGFTTGSTGTDTYITGGTYTKATGDLQLTDNLGGTVDITGITDTNIANTDLTLDGTRLVSLDGNDLRFVGGSAETFEISSSDIILSAATAGSISMKGLTATTTNKQRVLVLGSNGKIFYNDNIKGDTAISALTYNSEWGVTKELTDGTSGTTQLPFITGGTFNSGTGEITLGINDGLESDIIITGLSDINTYLTGGTYDNSTGTLTLERNDTVTVDITGFTTGTTEDTYVTGVTYDEQTKGLTLGLSDGVSFEATGFSPTITGGTYSDGKISLENNDGTSTQIEGLEILTHIGTTTASTVSVSGTTIDTVDATLYEGAFFDYVINDGTNYRAGRIQSVWDGSTITYNDFSTVDIGSTTDFVWDMELLSGDALLKANIAGGTWNIRIIKNII